MKYCLLHPDALAPKRATEHSAGFDLYALHGGILQPGARGLIPTGVAFEPDPHWYGRIAPRSGLAVSHGIQVHAGVIDPDFRDGVNIALINHGAKLWEWKAEERIAQIVFEYYYSGDLTKVEVLSMTARGKGGLGHTGL